MQEYVESSVRCTIVYSSTAYGRPFSRSMPFFGKKAKGSKSAQAGQKTKYLNFTTCRKVLDHVTTSWEDRTLRV
jgi:hypothetical protein